MTTFSHKIDDEYQWIFMMVNYCCFTLIQILLNLEHVITLQWKCLMLKALTNSASHWIIMHVWPVKCLHRFLWLLVQVYAA